MNPECTSFDTFQKSVLDVLDTLKEDLSKCKLSYDLLCHENTRLKLENERMKENEIDMLRASTVVNALNENHNLREEVRLLKGSLRKALSQNRSTMNASKDPHVVPEEEEKPVVPEEEEEKPVVMDIMTFKKISYYIDVEGRMYAMNADSTVGDMVGNARSVNGKYKVKFLNK